MEEMAKYSAGSKLRSLRLRAEIATQVEMSRRTGIAQCIISDLERGRRQLNPTWAKLIAEAVGTSWETLLAEVQEEENQYAQGEKKASKASS